MYKPKTVFSSNWDLIAPRVIDAKAHKVPNIAISLGVINFQLYVDQDSRPYKDIRIRHVVILGMFFAHSEIFSKTL